MIGKMIGKLTGRVVINFLFWCVVAGIPISFLCGILKTKLDSNSLGIAQVQSETQVDQRPVIVDKIASVSQLVTTRFYGNSLVPVEKNNTLRVLGLSVDVGSTKLLYIAYGSVALGIDLSKLTSDDITISDGNITVTLPPVVILQAALDLNQSKVYDVDSTLLNPTNDAIELADQAQEEALQRLAKSACESVESVAETQTKTAVTELVQLVQPNARVSVVFDQAKISGDYQTCQTLSSQSSPASTQP